MPDVPCDLAAHVGQPAYGNVTILSPDSHSQRNSEARCRPGGLTLRGNLVRP